MLIGQDFGPPEKEELNGTIANVRKMNDGIDVMFHENVDLEARDSQTDKNIVRYFELLGKNEIDKKKYPDLFFCNCNLGYRRDNRVNYYALMAICDVARKKYGTPVWSEQNEKY